MNETVSKPSTELDAILDTIVDGVIVIDSMGSILKYNPACQNIFGYEAFGREVKGRRKDGQVFPMYLSVGELPRESSRAFIGIIRDLSEDTRQQEQYEKLQQSHFHLSRVAAMDQMGTAIAHELNQPLSAIMNYLEAGVTILERKDEGLGRCRENTA